MRADGFVHTDNPIDAGNDACKALAYFIVDRWGLSDSPRQGVLPKNVAGRGMGMFSDSPAFSLPERQTAGQSARGGGGGYGYGYGYGSPSGGNPLFGFGRGSRSRGRR